MKNIWNWIQVALAAVGGTLGWFLGELDGFLYALIAFVVIDYLTGVMCAIVEKKLSSTVGFKGIFKKVLIFVMVGVGNIIDVQVLGQAGVLRTAVIFFYLSNEGVSMELQSFIAMLKKQPLVVSEWDERLWITLLDTATVQRDGRIVFRFKSGKAITA